MRRLMLLLIVIVLAAPVGVAAGDWPMWRANPARSAQIQDKVPDNLRLQWTRNEQPPRVAWQNPINKSLMPFDHCYEPVVSGKLLFYGTSRNDKLVAVDTESGAEKWRFYADAPIRFAPVCHKDRVLFCADDGFLYCLKASTGKLLWKYRGAPSSRRVIGNERLISMWPARGGPVLVDGKVYFAAGIWPFMGIFIHCVDAETGQAIWTNDGSGQAFTEQPHGGSISFAGVAPQGYLAASGGKLVVPGGRSSPACYDLATGDLIWYEPQKAAAGGSYAYIEGDTIICNGTSYNLGTGAKGGKGDDRKTTIRANSRTVSASRYRAKGTPASILAADGKVFVSTLSGNVSCFGPRGGGGTINGSVATPPRSKLSGKAAGVVRAAGTDEGWCLIFGLSGLKLASGIAQGSAMNVVLIEPDKGKVLSARRKLDSVGLYGTRISIVNANPMTLALPPYMASLIVCDDPQASGFASDKDFANRAWGSLKPYGGVICAPQSCKKALRGLQPKAKTGAAGSYLTLTREGPLPGAGTWTHQYCDAGNSVTSKDARVALPLGMLWFGGSSHANVLPRHGHGPTEQVVGGRLFIEGVDHMRAMDVYNGRIVWERELPKIGDNYNYTDHEPGANHIGSNYASALDGIYVCAGEECLRLDPATGKTMQTFTLPEKRRFAQVKIWGRLLIVAADPFVFNKSDKVGRNNWNETCSRDLFVLDRDSGKVKWSATANLAFHHNTIIVGKDMVYAIDRLPPKQEDALSRRGQHPARLGMKYELKAFNVRSGKQVWSTSSNVFGTWLGHSAEEDVLIQGGRRSRDMVKDEPGDRIIAYNCASGHSVLFDKKDGVDDGPYLLHHERIVMQGSGGGQAINIRTGRRYDDTNPITGRPEEWKFRRHYGCNSAVASENLLTFRSGAASYYDMAGSGGTGNFGGFKSGCTSSLIAADGVLSAPDYTRTCTCTYQNQCSLALVHMPDEVIELWSETPYGLSGKVKRMGVNLGAPGDRKDEAGTLWLDAPSVGGRSPQVRVSVEGDAKYFRRHATNVGGRGARWVAASGCKGATSISVSLGGSGSYRVRLYFCEPDDVEPGERVFDVAVDGGGAIRGLDVVKAAGGRLNCLVREMKSVKTSGSTLKVRLTPRKGSLPPIISGIEIAEAGEKLAQLSVNTGRPVWGPFQALPKTKRVARRTLARPRPTASAPSAPGGDPALEKTMRVQLINIIKSNVSRRKPSVKVNMGSKMFDASALSADAAGLTVDMMGAGMTLRWRALNSAAIASVARGCGASKAVVDKYLLAAGIR